MPLFDNENRILQIETEKEEVFKLMKNPLISQPFAEELQLLGSIGGMLPLIHRCIVILERIFFSAAM